MKRLIFIFFLLFPFISFASGVVHIKADHISYNKKLNTYYAYGNCFVYNDQYSLKADAITYNDTTNEVEANGNVFFKDSKGDWIKGSYAKINYSTYNGYVKNAVLFIKSNGLYVRAEKVVIYSKERYFIKDGSLTSCKCEGFIKNKKCYPKWSINASNTYVVKNKYLFAYPVILRAKSVPIFFMPFIRRNLDNERKTGFLMPQLGFSSTKGTVYIQPFFINLSPSEDITLYPFIYSKLGEGVKTEYRFYWTKHSKGKWDVTIFKEKTPYLDSNHKHTRVNIKAYQWADFGKYGYFRYKINLVNNRNNLRVINQNNIQLSGDRYTVSTASYYISRNDYFFSVYGNYYQDLVAENNKFTLQDLPVVKFGAIGKKLYKNLTLDFTQTFANEFRIEGNRGIYTDTTTFLYYPFNVYYFNIVPKVGFHRLWARWEDAPDKTKHYFSSFIPDYILSASTQLSGVFLNDNKIGFKGVKHVIKPTVSYEYVPERSQRFPDFVSIYPKTNIITFTLENDVIAKYILSKPVYRNIFYNKLVFQYDFNKKYGTPFPPVYEETTIKPFDFLTFNSKAYYFFKKHLFVSSTEEVDFYGRNKGFGFGYSMSRDSNYNLQDESINGKVYFYPTKKLYVYGEAQRSIIHSYYPTRKVGFMYSENCWGVGIDFYLNEVAEENSSGGYSTRLNRGFWITLNLTGLFSIKRQY